MSTSLKIDYINPSDLKPYAKNARKHSDSQIERIKRSIAEYGFINPVIINKKDGNLIVAGHARIKAAQEMNLPTVPTIDVSYLTSRQVKEYILADNRLAELSEWQDDLLREELTALLNEGSDLSMIGFEDFDLGLDDLVEGTDAEPDPIDREKPTMTQEGDIWILGDHKLMCGDSRSKANIDKLLGGELIDLLLTDPPYGVNYTESKNDALTNLHKGTTSKRSIANDNLADYKVFFTEFLAILPVNTYNSAYIFMSGQQLHTLRMSFEEAGFTWSDYLIWMKNHFVIGRKDYQPKHEYILYGWKGKHKFYGGRDLTTILEFDKPSKSDLHPTMKPIDLLEFLIKQSSEKGGIVFDSFNGSGSTLIAAHNTGRVYRGIEVDPYFVDQSVLRWEKATSRKAMKLEGKNHE